MKFDCEIAIGLPRPQVVALFTDPVNPVRWVPELLKIEPLEGIPGQVGAKARLLCRSDDRREMTIVETIIRRELPDRIDGRLDGDGVSCLLSHRFADEGAGTHWFVEADFHFSGARALTGPLMLPGLRRRTHDLMHRFKSFAEAEST